MHPKSNGYPSKKISLKRAMEPTLISKILKLSMNWACGLWIGPEKFSKYFGQLNSLYALCTWNCVFQFARYCVRDFRWNSCSRHSAIQLHSIYSLSACEENLVSILKNITKLTEVERLSLHHIVNLKDDHVSYLCKHQERLNYLSFHSSSAYAPSADAILEWIQSAEKLETLYIYIFNEWFTFYRRRMFQGNGDCHRKPAKEIVLETWIVLLRISFRCQHTNRFVQDLLTLDFKDDGNEQPFPVFIYVIPILLYVILIYGEFNLM